MKKLTTKNKILFSLVVIAITICFLVPLVLFSGGDSVLALDTGLETTAGSAGLPTNTTIPKIVGQVIYALLGFLGIVFIILLIYGGFMRMTAQGSSEKISKSMGIITSAIIGIVIILASFTITAFVLSHAFVGSGGSVSGGNNVGIGGT